MDHSPSSLPKDLSNSARGFLMGAADIVPGVSGGTVALILGIYQRLVTAISRVDIELLRLLKAGQWRGAAEHLDFRFLVSLGLGIGIGALSLASTMHLLLTEHRELTFAAFFGLILASGVLVGRLCRPKDAGQAILCLVLGMAGAYAAYWLVSQHEVHNQPGLAYTFFCGAVGICAMILPGISGSYLLLLLDKYEEIIAIIRRLTHLEASTDDLLTLAVFASGCAIGLLVFSKFLKWLLVAFGPQTMAVLCGFMIGSLWKVWPFQVAPELSDSIPLTLKEQALKAQPFMPKRFDAHVAACLAIAVACFAGVLIADAVARRARS
jgi:putative membrane protein